MSDEVIWAFSCQNGVYQTDEKANLYINCKPDLTLTL